MKKYPLIGISIIAVVVLILASLTNVVGFQTVQSSNQKIINKEVNQRELLFQTIVDIANNKEIQQMILKSQISREGLFNPDAKFPAFDTPVLTKNQLKQMYFIGLLLSKIISKSKIYSMVERYQVNNQLMQKEISVFIEKNTILNGEIKQLSNSGCDCENDKTMKWSFPVVCIILFPIIYFLGMSAVVLALFFDVPFIANFIWYLYEITLIIAVILNCFYI
jgi:hypothetical protein